MSGLTWARDSHNLFDYEKLANEKKQDMRLQEAAVVRRNRLNMICQEALSVNSPTLPSNSLLKVSNEKGIFYIENPDSEHYLTKDKWSSNHLSLVVRSLNEQGLGYQVQERDIIRVGRMKFHVKAIGYSKDTLIM